MRLLRLAPMLLLFVMPCVPAQTSSQGVLGTWREPGGSVISVENCGNEVCLHLLAVSSSAPSRTDIHNPDPALRSRPLCGLAIGAGFHLNGMNSADGGYLYDPKSGKTYKGTMRSEGATLHLRGYVGIKAFGRSETWQRSEAPQQPCR